jgi:Tfp pilus assembly protein FimT
MVIVLAILAIAAGIAVPLLAEGTMGRDALSRDAQRLASVIQHARRLALTTGQRHQVVLDAAQGDYQVNAADGTAAALGETPLRGRFSAGTRCAGLEINGRDATATPASIRLSPQGWADAAAILLVDNRGHARKIIVRPLLGAVEVREDTP